jgi:hypothetical protein
MWAHAYEPGDYLNIFDLRSAKLSYPDMLSIYFLIVDKAFCQGIFKRLFTKCLTLAIFTHLLFNEINYATGSNKCYP